MKYYLYIVGCAMNHSDAERISALLSMLGLQQSDNESEADLLIAVACSVRQSAVNRIYAKGESWKRRKGVITALSGCVLSKDKKKLEKIFDYIFPIEEIGAFVQKIILNKDNYNDHPLPKIEEIKESYFKITPQYESIFRAYIPIMTGCDNFCSYCAVPYVRGREKSRPEEDILKEFKSLVERGIKEIILLGQNVNSYGINNKAQIPNNKFVDLIKKIDKTPGDYRVYFYSNHPKDISGELIKTLPRLKHFPNYLHLPLQSGNDEILKKMNRKYTQEKYLDLVEKIKKEMPDITITTDIIVGFPGETISQFNDTQKVMKEVGYGMAFIAQYSPRPETLSSKMEDDVPKEEKKNREAVLQRILADSMLAQNKSMVGSKQRVLVDGKKGDYYYGRTDSYKVVEINLKLKTDNQEPTLGKFYNAKIVKAEPWKLIATLS